MKKFCFYLQTLFILNLLLNSIDSISEKKMENRNLNEEICFSLYQKDNYVTFEISDNGIGIAEDKLEAIFDSFFTMKKIRQEISK